VRPSLALVLATLAGCINTPCLTPPPTSTQQQRDIIVGLAAKFDAIPITPSLQTDFKQVVNTAYAQLNDVDTAYYIGLQAALCFADKGKWGRDVASQILRDLEADWRARRGAATTADHPQAAQIQAIKDAVASPPK
jgi:hypothetical protein